MCNPTAHTQIKLYRYIYIYIYRQTDSRRSRKIFSDRCKWFMALMFYLCVYLIWVCVCRSFRLIILSSTLGSPLHRLICLLCKFFGLFVVFPIFWHCACLAPSDFRLTLYANVKLQNYHLCNSCGNTNKSQFYGPAFLFFLSIEFILFFRGKTVTGGAMGKV